MMNTNNGVKWRRFLVSKKVEQINDHKLLIHRHLQVTKERSINIFPKLTRISIVELDEMREELLVRF